MSLHLIKDERIVWKSFPGKRYRTFIFARDFSIVLFLAIIFYEAINSVFSNYLEKQTVLYLSLGLVGLGLIYALITQIQFLLIQYYITNQRLIVRSGFFDRRLTSIKLENITDTKVHQTFSERLINTGNIFVFTANDGHVTETESDPFLRVPALKNIDEPFEVHRILEEMREENSHE